MFAKIIIRFTSGLRKEFLKKFFKTSVPELEEIDLWQPAAINDTDEKVWFLTVEHNNIFDVYSLSKAVKEIEKNEPNLDGSMLTADQLCNNADISEETNTSIRQYDCTVSFSIANNGQWSCEQIKNKIIEMINPSTDDPFFVDVTTFEYDNDFRIEICGNRALFEVIDIRDVIKWCEKHLVFNYPLMHEYRTAVKENHYEVTFETTSMNDYMEIQAACRKIIDRSKLIPFHCVCGHNFEIPKKSIVKSPYETDLCYLSKCPKCKTLCKTAMEQVK